MSYTETSVTTVNRFSRSWGATDHRSLVSEFISISKETNREPDSYHFAVEGDKLLDPNTDKPILDFIAEGVEKDVAKDLEDWAVKTDAGMGLWLSPKSIRYPCPKAILHKIAYTLNGKKVVLNSAVLFEGEIANPEFKRATLYTFPDSEDVIFRIVNFIERKSGTRVTLLPSERTSKAKALHYADQIKSGAPAQMVIYEMQKSGFLGKNSISCPVIGVAFSEGKYCEACPFCGRKIQKKINIGFRCECGKVKEC